MPFSIRAAFTSSSWAVGSRSCHAEAAGGASGYEYARIRGSDREVKMADIPRRMLGRTGLEVTALGYGAMELRGLPTGPDLSEREAEVLLNTVLDEGINFIDTSIDYGRSEERIGRYIARRRTEYVLASKCGCVPGAPIGTEHVHTARNVRAGVEHSLRQMQTDHLDLVQFHRSLSRAEFEAQGALAEALRLKEEGKVRYIGVSAVLPTLDEQIAMGVFDAFQIPYSALQRDHEQAIARAAAAGAGIIIRGGVARGAPADWDSRSYYMLSTQAMRDLWEKARLDELLDGMDRIEFMLRFTLSHPDLSTTIVGTADLEHLRANLRAAESGGLPAAVVDEAKQRLDAAAR
jgi:aryl-alcohol dehydrogenase-like predicted oxidoreductase